MGTQAQRCYRERAVVLLFVVLHITTCYSFTTTRPTGLTRTPPASTRRHMAFELIGYTDMLADYPLVTSSLTSGCFCGIGDALAQHKESQEQVGQTPAKTKQSLWAIEHFRMNFDTQRNLCFIIKGLGAGLIWLFWYSLADDITQSVVMPHLSSACGTMKEMTCTAVSEATIIVIGTTIFSVLLDQFLASPVVYALWDIPVPIILSKNILAEESQREHVDIPRQVQTKLGGLLVENAKVWTLANAVIYNLPMEYRVVAQGLTDLFWQSIVSSHVNERIDADILSVEELLPGSMDDDAAMPAAVAVEVQ
jgi:Mpv17 / PMP22 family